MVLPIITAISREVFDQVPTAHKEGALALGATQWEMIRTAVLPFGKPGIISASMLGLGRALGETLAVVILALRRSTDGAGWNWSVFNGGDDLRVEDRQGRQPSSTARRRPAPTSPPAWCSSC